MEETNKIRIKMGLKPLDDGGTPAADDKDAQAEGNYAKWREDEARGRERKYVWSSYAHMTLLIVFVEPFQANGTADCKVSISVHIPHHKYFYHPGQSAQSEKLAYFVSRVSG